MSSTTERIELDKDLEKSFKKLMKEKGFKTREEALHFLIEQYWQINSPAAHI